MASQDDLALLKQMYQRGEITDDEYDTLRRHVLWGTPLPQLVDEPPAGPGPAPQPTRPPQRPPQRPAQRPAPRQPTAPPPWSGAPSGPRPPPVAPSPPLGVDSRWGVQPQAQPTLARPLRRQPAGLQPLRVAGPAELRPVPRRRRRGPRFAALTASVVLALGLAGAGVWWFVFRTEGVRPAVYAQSVCTQIRDWQHAVEARSGALTRSLARENRPPVVRSTVESYYLELAARTDKLRGTLAGIGTPDVPKGGTYASGLVKTVQQQATVLHDSAARAGNLDTSNASAFGQAVAKLLEGGGTAISAVTGALDRPEAGAAAELRTAFGDEPTCAPFVG
jgi:Short C-terminal domain